MMIVENVRVAQGATHKIRVVVQTPGSVKPGKFGQSSETLSIVIRREDVKDGRLTTEFSRVPTDANPL